MPVSSPHRRGHRVAAHRDQCEVSLQHEASSSTASRGTARQLKRRRPHGRSLVRDRDEPDRPDSCLLPQSAVRWRIRRSESSTGSRYSGNQFKPHWPPGSWSTISFIRANGGRRVVRPPLRWPRLRFGCTTGGADRRTSRKALMPHRPPRWRRPSSGHRATGTRPRNWPSSCGMSLSTRST